MNGSAIAIWIICAVAVAGLAIWLTVLRSRCPCGCSGYGFRAARQGGLHVSEGGRSVAPRRDEPVVPGEAPAGDSLHPGGEDTADDRGAGGVSGHRRQASAIPPD
jgi:hypothetical protein